MSRINSNRVRGAMVAAVAATLALCQMTQAQSAPPRPNLSILLIPSFLNTPLAVDFDHDGRIDLVGGRPRGSSTDVMYRRGAGNGGFDTEQVIATGATPLAVADFDKDGNVDILVSGYAVIPGRGNGTFGAPVPTGVSDAGSRVVVADFDGNGTLDFAASEPDEGDSVSFFAGHGDFTFTGPTTYTVDPYTEQMVAADFDKDGRIDLAVAAIDLRRVDILMNRGGLLFTQSYLPLDDGRVPAGVAAADLDDDSKLDLIVSGGTFDYGNWVFNDGLVYVMHGNGDGTFTRTGTYATNAGPTFIALGDFNHDGVVDVATGNRSLGYANDCDGFDGMPDNVSILPGLGGGAFGAAATFTPVVQAPSGDYTPPVLPISRSLVVADLNGDGRADLFGPGALMINAAPTTNFAPTADAGRDGQGENGIDFFLSGSASDSDHDWLTFEWRDDEGTLLGTRPRVCTGGKIYRGVHTFTFTVRDARGGVATDTVQRDFGGTVPNGTSSTDIGNVSALGSGEFDGTTYTVRGSGADIWGTADEFHFVYQTASGNFAVEARIASIENVDVWTKAGLMIRERTGTPGARHASIFATPTTTKGIAFQRRTTEKGSTVSTDGPKWAPAVYVRLVRDGNTIGAYVRQRIDADWTLVGTQTFSALTEDLDVGMAVTSHHDGTVASAQFTDFQISSGTALPNGWTSNDVGNTDAAGSATYDGSAFTIEGAGADVWNATQEFTWAHTSVSGPFDFVTYVANVEDVNAWTKAGIMMRVGGSDPRYVFLVATPETTKGVSFQWGNLDGTSHAQAGPKIAAPVWLRLQREPSGLITASWRRNSGDAWSNLGSLGMGNLPPVLEVGLAVSSHVRGNLATATFRDVSLTRDTTGLPAGWSARDIGAVTYGGTTTWATTGHVMMSATGADIWGSADEFNYVSTSHSGDIDISVLVTDVQHVDAWTKAGLMLRARGSSDQDDASAPQASVFVTPDKGIVFQRRRAFGGQSLNTPGSPLSAPMYVRLTVTAGVVRAYYKENASDDWTLIGIDNYVALGTRYDAGLALTSHIDGTRAGAGFSEVTIR